MAELLILASSSLRRRPYKEFILPLVVPNLAMESRNPGKPATNPLDFVSLRGSSFLPYRKPLCFTGGERLSGHIRWMSLSIYLQLLGSWRLSLGIPLAATQLGAMNCHEKLELHKEVSYAESLQLGWSSTS